MGSNNPEWCVNTSGSENVFKTNLPSIQVEDHPLKTIVVTDRIPRRVLSSQSSTGFSTPVSTSSSFFDINAALEGIDPLTKFAREEMDPLTQMAAESAKMQGEDNKRTTKSVTRSRFQPWDSRKAAILNQFTTSEKITIVTSFLNEDEQVIVKAQTSSIDKMQHRLEQLDYFAEGSQKKFDLSQVEYIRRIEQLNKELVHAWNTEQRVKALKIAIQCAKMLSDTDVLQFYPSKFVLITDILDCFGKLVYERLRTKADDVKPGNRVPLPEDFMPSMVPELVKETCRNWFYKIASIRELVPRIFVEMAILKSYSFLTSSEYSSALMRLTRMIRGIGNPLVSAYARCYLCRVGITITSFIKDNQYLVENFYDFLIIYDHLFTSGIKNEILKQKLEMSSYLTLYTPALEFILEAAVVDASENILTEVLQKCQNQGNSSLLLNTTMAVYKPSYVSLRAVQFLDMISKSTDHGLSLHVLLRTLGLCITVNPPPMSDRKLILRNVWKLISRIENPEHYLNCAEPWVQYAVQFFIVSRSNEVNLILGDLIRHMSPDRNHEKFYPQLKLIVEKIMMYAQDIEGLISMDKFLPLIDLFQQEGVRVEICKTILLNCINENEIIDPVIINTLTFLCSVLHDSVTALTIEDESKQISDIICAILRKINYGQDFEQQLSFYVEARGAFTNLCAVLIQLVHSVNLLSVKVRGIVNGNHTRKTGAFVRACAAYCFITIPSIASTKNRLDLYLISGQVALFNNCLGQADAFFKAALTNITEFEPNQEYLNETYLISYIRKFLSTLLVVPDSPDRAVLSLTRVLLNVIKNYKWTQPVSLPELYLNVLEMLSIMGQDKYPYYVDKIDSNDSMYGCDPKFISEINKICTIILSELLMKLKELGPGRVQSALALKLFEAILNRVELSSTVLTFVYNLWQLSIKYGYGDIKVMSRTHQYYRSRSLNVNNKLFEQLMKKLNVPT